MSNPKTSKCSPPTPSSEKVEPAHFLEEKVLEYFLLLKSQLVKQPPVTYIPQQPTSVAAPSHYCYSKQQVSQFPPPTINKCHSSLPQQSTNVPVPSTSNQRVSQFPPPEINKCHSSLPQQFKFHSSLHQQSTSVTVPSTRNQQVS